MKIKSKFGEFVNIIWKTMNNSKLKKLIGDRTMNINVDMKISDKIIKAINIYYNTYGKQPTKIILNSDDYLSLYIYAYYMLTRDTKTPHGKSKFGDCDIEIGYVNEIICL